ncbi:MAG: excinuclease ABC subunit A [Spirochaetaceae bacterium]|nr:MAG: excinuclease ABC subunit A [Spirochaetaceae bacterium]
MQLDPRFITVRGARQNNLKDITVQIPLNRLTVVTGVSGSGKSSLAFDTVFAEGQRRYVETFSAYTRQFLDRMDKPMLDGIDGIPPAIAIDQTNPVRTSRSTVGTMTELNDHLKLLYARIARLFCRDCDRPVLRDTPESVTRDLFSAAKGEPVVIAFAVTVPESSSAETMKEVLASQGYTRFFGENPHQVEVIQDRLVLSPDARSRVFEDVEAAFRFGGGKILVHVLDKNRTDVVETRLYSADLHCPHCDIHYRTPSPSAFSFNSPIGACDTCRGFGRVIGIDYDLVVPDKTKTLAGGAIKPLRTKTYRESQEDLERYARRHGIPLDVPWSELSDEHVRWVIDGEGDGDGVWYGLSRFFSYLEARSYKMHIRVLLSKYRSYRECTECHGARLKSESLMWRIDGKNIRDVMVMPVSEAYAFLSNIRIPSDAEKTVMVLMEEISARFSYLLDVGLSYLTLDRQSRTLSGGEVQRINLTTALGTSLVNTLFVLDEPSIGLHSRDIGRLIGILHRLRDAGNTLLVVEHDPEVIRAADHVIDMGPGPGEQGGTIVFAAGVPELLGNTDSITARYLRGELRVARAATEKPGTPDGEATSIRVGGAAEHNLAQIDVEFPLGRFVCLTGVSGSGKSTLMQDVLYRALRRLKNKPTDTPGTHREITGHERIDDVVLVDQSPIGKTTRSNPASYVGAFDAIRKVFAAHEDSRVRGYTTGTFSFNSGAGRCPTCGGNGFEHVEMQFLSDVYIRCPDCDGARFRPDVLEVRIDGANGPASSIADVLAMTVDDACDFFEAEHAVVRALEPLQAVGLGYLRLGQPVPTLSGGEAQRLKLAAHLATGGPRSSRRLLFLLDEPTTGLHFSDIAVLVRALRELIAAGHSLVVIEHNLDTILASDWVIELGPEGGDAGGRVVFSGTPDDMTASRTGHTGHALAEYARTLAELTAGVGTGHGAVAAEPAPGYHGGPLPIVIKNAREHNLKNIDVTIPPDSFTVITGVSGSGKSTVAFDILFAEGQRRYLESLNAYARQFVEPASRPEIDGVTGVPPTVAIEQRTSRGGRKSTVATVTEIYHFLRLLFVKLGTQHCPHCAVAIEPQTPDAIFARIMQQYRDHEVVLLAPLITARKGYYTDLAAWARTKGFESLRVDGEYLPVEPWPRLDRYREHSIELPVARLTVGPRTGKRLKAALAEALAYGKGAITVANETADVVFSTKRVCPVCGESFRELDPRLLSFNSRHGWCPECYGTGVVIAGFDGEQTGEEAAWLEGYTGHERSCPTCNGRRLRPEALAVTFKGESIDRITALSVDAAAKKLASIRLTGRELAIARDLIGEVNTRLAFLADVGLGYLTLDRSAPSLSGGEAQRIRLASQLGSNLRGVCYILDEPSIGLHARDNERLLATLYGLKKKGNTVVVVEHDDETIRSAEHVIDLGPGGGITGGHVVAAGTVDDLMKNEASITGRFLARPLLHPMNEHARPDHDEILTIRDASLHNLKKITVDVPLRRLVCVTGVSGSGKSTLVRNVMYDGISTKIAAARHSRKRSNKNPTASTTVSPGETEVKFLNWKSVDRALEVDQTPIGKTPRSCPATYIGFWDDIRALYAELPEARVRGYTASRFSFNVTGGRCEECLGQGYKRIGMSFLPDVLVQCESCGGRRFDDETLSITFRDRSIADVLAMSIDEAVEFFSFHPRVHHALELLQQVGLGYVKLGQQSPSLSGGEAQRIKLVTELAKAGTPTGKKSHTLYLLDEPTIGLHTADVEKLVGVLHRLVDAGNTVVIIEHNLDVIAEADWIIDLGPEGGAAGGRIVAEGPPATLAANANGKSHTARFLAAFLAERGR